MHSEISKDVEIFTYISYTKFDEKLHSEVRDFRTVRLIMYWYVFK